MLDQRRTSFLTESVHRRIDTSGTSASCASSSNAHAESGVSSAAFRIAAPHSSAGKAFQATLAKRVRCDDQTRNSKRLPDDHRALVRHCTGRRLTVEARPPATKNPDLDRGVGLSEGILARLACFSRHEVPNRARCSCIRIAMRRRISPRLTTVMAAQAGRA